MGNSLKVLLGILFVTSGCASTISAIHNDPARVHTLRPNRFFTLNGNSRMAFQVERYDKEHPDRSVYIDSKSKRPVYRMAWCAESLPEVAQAVNSSSKPNIKLSEKLSGGTEDAFATALTQTFARTEIAEIYRQMGWQACQAWAQGVMTDEEYKVMLDGIVATGANVVTVRALQPLSPDAAKIAAGAMSAAKKKLEEEAARKAKVAACAAAPTKECVNALYSPSS